MAVLSTPLKIAVAGASGRMGKMLIEAIDASEDAVLMGALMRVGSPSVGTDAALFLGKPRGVLIASDLAKGLINSEFLIDLPKTNYFPPHTPY